MTFHKNCLTKFGFLIFNRLSWLSSAVNIKFINNFDPDLDQFGSINLATLGLTVFLKDFFEKVNLKKSADENKSMKIAQHAKSKGTFSLKKNRFFFLISRGALGLRLLQFDNSE